MTAYLCSKTPARVNKDDHLKQKHSLYKFFVCLFLCSFVIILSHKKIKITGSTSITCGNLESV